MVVYCNSKEREYMELCLFSFCGLFGGGEIGGLLME